MSAHHQRLATFQVRASSRLLNIVFLRHTVCYRSINHSNVDFTSVGTPGPFMTSQLLC
jgi:hypothetical protein